MNSSSWVIVGPQADAGLGDKNDNKGFLVGRWVACAPGAPAAIEFGTNNRWRHLVRAGSGEYEPVPGNPITSRGHFYLLSANGQLELIDDRRLLSIVNSTVPQGSGSAFVATLPNREAMQISGGAEMILPAGFYARMAPSPLLGWDNAPSTEAPPCKLVGTWDATSATGGTSRDASFSFDDAGHFVGAPGRNVDLCSAPTMYGTYELTSGAFQLTTNVGMGACSFWYAAGYQITFSGSCTIATLERPAYDNCTGGRGYFNEPTTLFKRLQGKAIANKRTLPSSFGREQRSR